MLYLHFVVVIEILFHCINHRINIFSIIPSHIKIGRTANFLDSLTVGLSGRNRTWTQVIPNSQMVVVPWPPNDPSQWKAQLFVTPSKLIWMSVISLGATCVVITIIILILHVKERRMDQFEKLQESQPFHFDAM